jgi:thioredoxin 1
MAQAVSQDDFQSTVLDASGVVLVDFYAEWCGPCQGMLPVVEDLAANGPEGLTVVKVNIDDAPEVASEYGVMSIPTFKVFKDGEVVAEAMGGGKSKEDMMALVAEFMA